VEHPKIVGDRTTLAVIAGLHSAGYDVLLPFGENTRYDLVIDGGGRLARVQCKTGRLREGAIRFNTCSSYAHHSNPRASNRDYLGQVDFFAVHCSDTGGVYLVPIGDLPTKRTATFRVAPARNSQIRGIRQAAKYRVASVNVVAS
jgi:hypothetical protein